MAIMMAGIKDAEENQEIKEFLESFNHQWGLKNPRVLADLPENKWTKAAIINGLDKNDERELEVLIRSFGLSKDTTESITGIDHIGLRYCIQEYDEFTFDLLGC